jgi:hypothetical protein
MNLPTPSSPLDAAVQHPPRGVKALLHLGSAATIQIARRPSRTGSSGQRTQFQEHGGAKQVVVKHKSESDPRPPERWGINE